MDLETSTTIRLQCLKTVTPDGNYSPHEKNEEQTNGIIDTITVIYAIIRIQHASPVLHTTIFDAILKQVH